MMSKEQIESILDEIGIEYRYHHFEPEEAIAPPFLCWLMPESNNFAADGKVYHQSNSLDIELYTDQKDFDLEKKIETVLDQYNLYYETSERYIETENMYEVLYEMEV